MKYYFDYYILNILFYNNLPTFDIDLSMFETNLQDVQHEVQQISSCQERIDL